MEHHLLKKRTLTESHQLTQQALHM